MVAYKYTFFLLFFFRVLHTSEIYTLSLHDALPIYLLAHPRVETAAGAQGLHGPRCGFQIAQLGCRSGSRSAEHAVPADRKSTRLNSSHQIISYAVFCLKKKI